MPSMFESAMMLDALEGDLDKEMPHAASELREEARRNPTKWRWCIREAQRAKRRE